MGLGDYMAECIPLKGYVKGPHPPAWTTNSWIFPGLAWPSAAAEIGTEPMLWPGITG
jgi:hypothetical protein